MHDINNTNNAQFDNKNPRASPKVFAFVFFAENRYICTGMQGDTATAQAKRAGGRKTVQNDGRRCGDRNRKPLQFVDIHRAYIRAEAPLSAQPSPKPTRRFFGDRPSTAGIAPQNANRQIRQMQYPR